MFANRGQQNCKVKGDKTDTKLSGIDFKQICSKRMLTLAKRMTKVNLELAKYYPNDCVLFLDTHFYITGFTFTVDTSLTIN